MESLEIYPNWDRIAEYFENSVEELSKKKEVLDKNVLFEDLLTIETYQLWKLLKQM